ncbi:4750_t:CDS:2 [Rhizophagus irregularis]|nr:4750_t:CDS:2 [Rhizophagus irregularis]
MSSPATIPRTFINMSASSPIDLTMTPLPVRRTPVTDIIIISESEDENNDSSHRNNSNYRFNDNNNPNSMLGFDSQNIFNSSTRHSSNNIQDSSGNNTNYNLRNGLAGLSTNGSSSNRSTSTRPNRTQSRHSIRKVLLTANDIHYGNNNSSGSSRSPMSTFFDPSRANTNINSNDVQILNTPPRRRNNNSPKPPILSGHARDLEDSHTLICADCDELLHEKLWALSNCGHVVCGSCVDKYKYSEKKKFPCPSCKKTVNSKNILPLYV